MDCNPKVFLLAAQLITAGKGACWAIVQARVALGYDNCAVYNTVDHKFFSTLFPWQKGNKHWPHYTSHMKSAQTPRVLALLFCYWELKHEQKKSRRIAKTV